MSMIMSMIMPVKFKCPKCGETQEEVFNRLPFKWFCDKCHVMYSVTVAEDKEYEKESNNEFQRF